MYKMARNSIYIYNRERVYVEYVKKNKERLENEGKYRCFLGQEAKTGPIYFRVWPSSNNTVFWADAAAAPSRDRFTRFNMDL